MAPESPGNLFDGAEIDELLSLSILTMTDDEKREMRETDERTRHILERTEALSPGGHGCACTECCTHDRTSQGGDRVRLRPQKTADIFDLALAGQVAEIEAVETDFEGRVHLAVVLEDDPGRDLGMLRQPGHRFFFSPEEVEPIAT